MSTCLRPVALVLLLAAAFRPDSRAAASPGVVVDDVTKGSAAEKAGLKPGDVLVSWSGPAVQGALASIFDYWDLQEEQMPRGPVALTGRRDGPETSWTIPPGPSGLTVRPILEEDLLARYLEGKGLVQAKNAQEGAARWRAAAEAASGEVAVWLSSRAAEALAEAKIWPDVDAAYEKAIDGAAGRPRVAGVLLRRWAITFRDRRQWDQAEERYRRALGILEAGAPESLALARTFNSIGGNAWQRVDLAAAQQHYQRARELWERLAPAAVELSSIYHNLGNVAQDRGDLAEAEEHFRRAVAVEERLGSSRLSSELNSLGVVVSSRGDLAGAEEYYRRALALDEKRAPGSLDVAMRLNNLGTLAGERWDLESAQSYLLRALAIKEKEAPDSANLATTLVNLGHVAYSRDDLTGAEQHFRRALVIREKAEPGSLDLATLLGSLGRVAERRGDVAAAQDYLQRGLAITEQRAPRGLHQARILTGLGIVAARRGDLPAAEAFHQRALDVRSSQVAGTAQEAESLYEMATVHRAAGRGASAAALFLRALDALETQRARLGGTHETGVGFAATHDAYYHDAAVALVEQRRPAEALHVIERSRARALLALLAERDILFAADVPLELTREKKQADAEYDRVQSRLTRLDAARDEAEIQRLRARSQELRTVQDEIATRLRRASPRLASLQYPQPLDLPGARRALDPGTVLLSYSVGDEETLLFVVQPEGVPEPGFTTLSIPTGERALSAEVEALRRGIQRAPAGTRAALAQRSARLYDLLVRPAESEIARGARVLISADGPLQSLPFAALVRRERPATAYLVEWKPLHVAASATVYAELKKARRAGADASLVAFGDPRYPARVADASADDPLTRGFTLKPLPSTRREVARIAKQFPGRAQTYLGDLATEERAKTLGQDTRYVHFACHGFLDERFPLDSALALSPPVASAEGGDNGLLQAWEIFDRVRIDADLVTLSACNTALGKEMGGEGLLGLTRAFHYAGARSVLGTLWGVPDTSTAILMERFYAHLAAGRSRDEALRAAQIEFVRRRSSLSHPFRWAAFQLSGDWN